MFLTSTACTKYCQCLINNARVIKQKNVIQVVNYQAKTSVLLIYVLVKFFFEL